MERHLRCLPGVVSGVGIERAVSPLWSHACSWRDLLVPVSVEAGRSRLDLGDRWVERWTATARSAGGDEVFSVVRLAEASVSGWVPVRRFTWRRDQRHRPGLEYLVSTGRRHGFESLREDELLVVLDFCADVVDVLAQPLQLRFRTTGGWRRHIPDYLVLTDSGTWLVDVRPARLIAQEDLESFAAAAEVALACGWGYVVAAGWLPHVMPTVDAMYGRRRPVADLLGVQAGLLAAAKGGRQFGEIAAASEYWPVARAHLLHLLWRRVVGVDLSQPLTDSSVVVLAGLKTM
jgi:hypothetical protein